MIRPTPLRHANVRCWQILLQKSKIERPGESRESRFLDAPAVARLSGANTKVGGRFGMKGCGPSCRHTRNASAVFKIFVLHPKKTFATISANSRLMHRSKLAPIRSLRYRRDDVRNDSPNTGSQARIATGRRSIDPTGMVGRILR